MKRRMLPVAPQRDEEYATATHRKPEHKKNIHSRAPLDEDMHGDKTMNNSIRQCCTAALQSNTKKTKTGRGKCCAAVSPPRDGDGKKFLEYSKLVKTFREEKNENKEESPRRPAPLAAEKLPEIRAASFLLLLSLFLFFFFLLFSSLFYLYAFYFIYLFYYF